MFRSIASTLGNCFKIPELKSRILFTIMLLAVCRLTAFIVIPGIDGQALAKFFNDNAQASGGLLVMYNTFAGGALGNCAISSPIFAPMLQACGPTFTRQSLKTPSGRTPQRRECLSLMCSAPLASCSRCTTPTNRLPPVNKQVRRERHPRLQSL